MVKVKEDMTSRIMKDHGVPNSRLTVIKQVDDYIQPNGRHKPQWLCECSCSEHKQVVIRGDHLKSTLSCGCISKEKISEIGKKSRKYNDYKFYQDYGICYATNTNSICYFDIEDYSIIKDYCWYEDTSTGYMKTRTIENTYISMHRLITKNKYEIVDHINRNKLDNRKINLRNATKRINILNRNGVISTNTSGYTGVHFSNSNQKWSADIYVDNQNIHLGCFINKDDAVKARLQAEAKYYGDFAPQRHLFEKYGIM